MRVRPIPPPKRLRLLAAQRASPFPQNCFPKTFSRLMLRFRALRVTPAPPSVPLAPLSRVFRHRRNCRRTSRPSHRSSSFIFLFLNPLLFIDLFFHFQEDGSAKKAAERKTIKELKRRELAAVSHSPSVVYFCDLFYFEVKIRSRRGK